MCGIALYADFKTDKRSAVDIKNKNNNKTRKLFKNTGTARNNR